MDTTLSPKYILALMCYCAPTGMVLAQNWTTYSTATTSSTISHNHIRDIEIDAEGRKWFATGDGVSVYDNGGWTIFTTEDGLVNHDVWGITIDLNGDLWFATNYGVSRFDGFNWTNYLNIDGSVPGKSIAIEDNGNIWIGGSGHVHQFDGANWTVFEEGGSIVRDIAIDTNGIKWFASYNGAHSYDGNTWMTYTTENSGLANDNVRAVFIDSSDNKWFGTNEGVSKYDGTDWTSYDLIGTATDITSDTDGNILVSTTANPGRIYRFEDMVFNSVFSTGEGGGIFCLEVESADVIWLGTGDGISRWEGEVIGQYTTENGIGDNYISVVAIDQNDNKWIGTNSGLSTFDGISWLNYSTEDGLLSNSITDIIFDTDGNTWCGLGITDLEGAASMFDGMNWTNYDSESNIAFGNGPVTCLSIDPDQNIWFGTWGGGVAVYDGDSWEVYDTNDGLTSNFISDVTFDAGGNAWLGTTEGVLMFDGMDWINYTAEDGLINDIVRSVLIDGEDIKWFGTDTGISKFNGDTWNDFDFGTTPLAIDEAGSIWASASTVDGGISRYTINGVSETFTVEGDITLNAIASIAVDAADNIWIGTIRRGVKKFDPPPPALKPVLSVTDDTDSDSLYDVSAYPIPSHDFISVKGNQLPNSILRICNMSGETILREHIASETSLIDIRGLSSGYYIIFIENKLFQESLRFIKK